MMFVKKKNYHKRDENPKFPKNKTFSYRSARRATADSDYLSKERGEPGRTDQAVGKKPDKISKLLNIVILLIIFSSLGYLSYIDTSPVIKLDQKAVPRNENEYYEAVKNEIAASIIYKNKLTFNTSKFSQDIKSQFPEIEDVFVEIPVFRHRPTINITVSEPAARLVTNDKSYILDSNGKALFSEDRINDRFDTSKLVSINDASGHTVVLGKPVLTEQQINFIREIISQSSASNIPAKAFNLEFGGSAVDVKFDGSDYIVKFSFYEDPKQSSGAYFALREEISRGSVPAPKQYVDLRIPDKAYLK